MNTKSIRNQAINNRMTFDELNREHILSLHKIILADRWNNIDKTEKKAFVKMMIQKYNSDINIPELMALVDEAKDTTIFKMYQDDDLFNTE